MHGAIDRFAQELLTTFSEDLGEVALRPSTGGAFFVHVVTLSPSSATEAEGKGEVEVETLIWDRKAQGGFPGMSFPLVHESDARRCA